MVNWLINSMKPQSKSQLTWDTCSLAWPISASVRNELVMYETVKCVNELGRVNEGSSEDRLITHFIS